MYRFSGRRPKSFRIVMHAIVVRCRGALVRGVRRTKADRYVKRHKSATVALALVSCYLLKCTGLRSLKRRLDHDRLVARCVGWLQMSIAQLSKVLRDRPPELWLPLVEDLSKQVVGPGVPRWLRVIDSSMFRLSEKLLSRCTGKRFNNRGNAGFHATMVLEAASGVPVIMRSKVGQGSDSANGRRVLPAELDIRGHVYLFDRGFRNYGFYDELIDREADFVTRQSATVHYEVLETLPLDPAHLEITSDQQVLLGSANAKNRMTNPVRRIVLETDDGPVIFLTSCFDLDAVDAAELYRRRWFIEVFFRWLKSVIGCKRPLGYSQPAAEHSIYAALVAYLLTLLFTGADADPTKLQKTAQIKAAFEILCASIHQTPRRQDLQALGFA